MPYPLGKLPATIDPRTLRLEAYMAPSLLAATPPVCDNSGYVTNWGGTLGNTTAGCCVEAYGGHADTLWTAMAGDQFVYTDTQIIGAYTALTGWLPADGGEGPGTNPLAFLNYWRTVGISGRKIGAYTTVGSGWARTAIWLFGSVGLGIGMPLIWQVPETPFVWDYNGEPLTGEFAPSSWGGHFVPVIGYDTDGVKLNSWGSIYTMTWRAWNQYSLTGEIYAAIAKDMLGPSGKAPNGFNGLQLAADLEQFGPVDL